MASYPWAIFHSHGFHLLVNATSSWTTIQSIAFFLPEKWQLSGLFIPSLAPFYVPFAQEKTCVQNEEIFLERGGFGGLLASRKR